MGDRRTKMRSERAARLHPAAGRNEPDAACGRGGRLESSSGEVTVI
jgi:hypothetical protein